MLRAKEKGYIKHVKPVLEEMVAKGRWYSEAVCRAFLTQAGE
nr:DUF3368 domain-containing protein [uncultured Thiocystis sp.]